GRAQRHPHRAPARRHDGQRQLANERGARVRREVARTAAVIRIDAVWLALEPLDMRAGTQTALARAIKVFGEARARDAYLFANRRANRMKVLVHDGMGVWLCARRLHQGTFSWAAPGAGSSPSVSLSAEQLRALVIGLPWHRLGDGATIRVA